MIPLTEVTAGIKVLVVDLMTSCMFWLEFNLFGKSRFRDGRLFFSFPKVFL